MSEVKYFTDRKVPYETPEHFDILLVGEAPGETEYEQLRPFVGDSGQLLVACLNRAGVMREEIGLANLCGNRPYKNKFENLLHTPVLKEGVNELYAFIEKTKPTVIGALGKWPCMFLTGKDKIKKWRGSIIPYVNDKTIKVIPTMHPAAVLRQREIYPIFALDIQRIVADSKFKEYRYPERILHLNPTGLELEAWVQRLIAIDPLTVDIETVKKSTHILCVGFGISAKEAVSISAETAEGRAAISRILAASTRKIFHGGIFDMLQLAENKYLVSDPTQGEKSSNRLFYWDTMAWQHAIQPELPKALEFLTSIHTREPYYKSRGRASIPDDAKGWSLKTTKREDLYEYNARDCAVTFEVHQAQQREAQEHPEAIETFEFTMEQLAVTFDVSRAGLPIDHLKKEEITRAVLAKWARKQAILNSLARTDVNVNSYKKVPLVLYDKEYLGLPPRRNREGGITADEDAIVGLIAYIKDYISTLKRDETILQWRVKETILRLILEIRGLRKLLSSYLMIKVSPDGRIRSTFKATGTETGRWSSAKYIDDTGFNAQTMPRDPIEVSDEDLKVANPELEKLAQEDAAKEQDEDDEEESE